MDFWRAYRVLVRRKFVIAAVVALTLLVVGTGIALYGRQYDAQTWFGPSDQAVRGVMNAGNDGLAPRVLTDDVRAEEAQRIAAEAGAPNSVAQAVYDMYYAANVRAVLEQARDGQPIVEGDASPTYDQVRDAVNDGIHRLSERAGAKANLPTVEKLENVSGMASALWPDFIYLDAKLDYYNIPKDFLKPENIPGTIAELRKGVEVMRLNSRDITLSVRDRDRRLAEIWASALTAAYKNSYDSRNHGGAIKQVAFYRRENAKALLAYNAAQDRLSKWRETHKDIFLPDQVSNAIRKSNEAKTQLETITASLKDKDAQLAAKKARLASLPKTLSHVTKTDNPEIESLRGQLSTLQADLALKRGTMTEENPEVQRVKDQVNSVQKRLQEMQGTMVSSKTVSENTDWTNLSREIAALEQERRGLAARTSTVQSVLAEQARLVAAVPKATTEMQGYTNAFAGAQERLQDTSRKLRQAEDDLQKANSTGALEVQYWAGPAPGTKEHPESPAQEGAVKKNLVLLMAALMMSLVGSAGVVLALDFLDTSIKMPMDVERLLDAPVTGIVPRLDGASHISLPRITHSLPGSPHAEAYRFLGTDILLSASGDDPCKTLMVATAKPGQGGTSTVCNLAITLAQAGQTVALVDADLRRPSLHQVFELGNEQGLSTVLSNGKLAGDVLQRTEIENLFVMTGGPTPDNAWKLLRSAKMKDIIADLSRDYDFVLFDTPSAVVFADAATLASMVDGVILVVRAHEAPSGSELQVKALLNKTKARIVGVVLNDMPAQQVDSARFYNHYYAPGSPRQEAVVGASQPALPERGDEDGI
jgi:capsular exopolysaccharide synthesis family protein